MDGPGVALAQRVRPGAVTISHLHLCCGRGGSPMGLEILSTLSPTESSTTVAPAVDVTTTNWTRSTGAGTWFSHVDDWIDTSDYLTPTNLGSPLLLRSSASTLASKRIRYVEVQLCAAITGVSFIGGLIEPVLNISGTTYEGNPSTPLQAPGTSIISTRWYLNPATGKPWTLTEANSFLSGGTNSFGAMLPTSSPANVLALYSIQVVIGWATENRMGSFYSDIIGSDVATGWKEYALSSTSALSANTWYWVVVWSYVGGSIGGILVPVLRFPETTVAASASASVGEHRQVLSLTVDGGGAVQSSSSVTGEIFPVLLDSSGTIRSQSAPYVEVDLTPVFTGSPAAQLGQEVTTSGVSTPYGAVRIACGYQTTGVTPNAPLLVKVRTTSFTGTVQATATITPTDLVGGALQDVQKDFDVVYTPPTSTKIFITVESAATSGAGWNVCILDQRSDLVTTTTAAEVQGAGFGGTTDAASPASSTRDQRYDLSLSLVSAPTPPGAVAALARAGI